MRPERRKAQYIPDLEYGNACQRLHGLQESDRKGTPESHMDILRNGIRHSDYGCHRYGIL